MQCPASTSGLRARRCPHGHRRGGPRKTWLAQCARNAYAANGGSWNTRSLLRRPAFASSLQSGGFRHVSLPLIANGGTLLLAGPEPAWLRLASQASGFGRGLERRHRLPPATRRG